VSSITSTRRSFVWRFETAHQYLEMFRSYYGPTVKAFDALDEAGRHELSVDLLAALDRFAIRSHGTLLVPAEYLEVVAVRA
jgi:hypothetical protein